MASKKLTVVLAGDASGATEAMDKVGKDAETLGGRMSKLGGKLAKGMAAGGTMAVAALGKGLVDGLEQQSIISSFETQLGVSPEYAQKMGKASGAAYTSGFGESFEDVAAATAAVNTAFGDWVDDADLQPLTEQAIALSETFDVDMTEAMGAAKTMLHNGLVKDGGEAMDTLAASLKGLSPAVRDEVLAATNEYSKHFAALGISGQEAMKLLSSSDGVIGVDKMGDALKELTIRATDMSQTSIDAYHSMGLGATDMSRQMLAGGDTAKGAFKEIIAGLQGIDDPVKQANTAIALFGTPLEDLGTDQIPAFLNSLQNMDKGLRDVDGKAKELADSIKSNPLKQLEALKRKGFQAVTDFAVNKFLPAAKDAGKAMANFAKKLKPVFDPIQKFVKANPAPALAALAVVVGVPLVAAFWAWASAAGAAAVATLTATWPIIAITAGVAALAAGVVLAYQKVGWFRAAVDAVGRFLKDKLWPILQQIGRVIGVVLVAYVKSLIWYFTLAKNVITAVVTTIVNVVVGIAKRIAGPVSTMWNGIKTAFVKVRDWLSDRINGVVSTVSGLPDRIRSAASGMWDGIKDAFRGALNWIIRGWNGLEFTMPEVNTHIPGVGKVGGFTIGVPDIPELHTGGTVPGGPGNEPVVRLQGGEEVLSRRDAVLYRRGVRPNPGVTVIVNVGGSVMSERDLVGAVIDGVNRAQRLTGRPVLPGVA